MANTPIKRPVITQNFLSPIEFRFVIQRLPHVTFFVQSANVPGLSAAPVPVATPFNKFFTHGDELDYNTFNIQIRVDENMKSYSEIMNWMLGLNFPEQFSQFAYLEEGDGLYSYSTLTIMTNSKNPNIELKLVNIFPISLSEIDLDTKNETITPAIVDIAFQIDRFELEVLT